MLTCSNPNASGAVTGSNVEQASVDADASIDLNPEPVAAAQPPTHADTCSEATALGPALLQEQVLSLKEVLAKQEKMTKKLREC